MLDAYAALLTAAGAVGMDDDVVKADVPALIAVSPSGGGEFVGRVLAPQLADCWNTEIFLTTEPEKLRHNPTVKLQSASSAHSGQHGRRDSVCHAIKIHSSQMVQNAYETLPSSPFLNEPTAK